MFFILKIPGSVSHAPPYKENENYISEYFFVQIVMNQDQINKMFEKECMCDVENR